MKRTNQHIRNGSYTCARPLTCSTSSCQLHPEAIISKVILFHFCLSKLTSLYFLALDFYAVQFCRQQTIVLQKGELRVFEVACGWSHVLVYHSFINVLPSFFLSHLTADSVQPPRFHPCNLIATPLKKFTLICKRCIASSRALPLERAELRYFTT